MLIFRSSDIASSLDGACGIRAFVAAIILYSIVLHTGGSAHLSYIATN